MQFAIVESQQDDVLVTFYHNHWLDMGISEHDIAGDWRTTALDFITQARLNHSFAGFLALSDDNRLGGACCHTVDRVFPAFRQTDAVVLGYIWGVYVLPSARGTGIGTALVKQCIRHLKARGCGRILLHAGQQARPIYDRLGFTPTDELALSIND